MPLPHESPASCDDLMARLGRALWPAAVVVRAQYSPDPGQVERVLIFAELGQRLRQLADVWLSAESLEQALQQLPDARGGGCSAMYGTPPIHVWAAHRDATGSDQLKLWRRRSLVARFTALDVHLKGAFGRWVSWPCTDFDTVRAFLSSDWSRRGVRLEATTGPARIVASTRELSALFDPTYDALDVLCDAAWTVDLARAVAATSQIRFSADEALS